jgi:uncharacterized protein (TIGR00730 family)
MACVAVYCGSAIGRDPAFASAAEELGQKIGQQGWRLIYGGASIGLMGKVADATLGAGGEVIGVMPNSLIEKEIAHRGLTSFLATQTMHERKALMIEKADAIVTLPGGFGTFDEVMEAITWAQLGYHQKPIVFINVNGFYDLLFQFLKHAEQAGFIRGNRHQLLVADSAEQAISLIRNSI